LTSPQQRFSLTGCFQKTMLLAVFHETPRHLFHRFFELRLRIDGWRRRRSTLTAGEHSVELGGIKFWYDVSGQGPFLIIQAPGWGIGSSYLQNGLSPLSTHFTTVFYDPRGSGRSSHPSDEKRMSTSDMVEDLEQLRKYWGLQRLNLLGHSHGGAIAIGYAIRYPKRVDKLILVDSSVYGYAGWEADRKKNIDAGRGDKRFAEAILASEKDEEPKTDEEFAAQLDRILPLYFYDPDQALPAFHKTVTT
jgi:proline iminopeptidase